MAGRQRHVFDFARVPCTDDVATTIRVVLEGVDDFFDLVGAAAIAGAPVCPLRTVYTAEVALFVCPFIPNTYLVVF